MTPADLPADFSPGPRVGMDIRISDASPDRLQRLGELGGQNTLTG